MDTVSMLNKMSFYCQPILPLVYDESMSYYETLRKVVGQLNNTGETVNKLKEGLTGEISDRQAADAALDVRIKEIEKTNKKIHFLKVDTLGHLLTENVTREKLSQWVQDGDIIAMLYAPDEQENSWAVATNYRCLGARGAETMQLSFYVPISIVHNAGKSGSDVAQEVVVISLPVGELTNQWVVRSITTTIPATNADGFVNLMASVGDDGAVTCDVEPGAIVEALRNYFRSTNQFAVAVNARLNYDGKQYHSSAATVKADASGSGNIRIEFENYYNGVRTENGARQLNTETIFLVGDASTNVWSVETIDHKTFDFSRYEGFQFTRGENNIITANDESTPNAVYAQYHSDTSGKIYQNLPVFLIDTVDNAEYWNGVFDIKDGKHMTFTFVTSNYATASDKMLVRVIELSANVNTTAWKYAEKEFELPITGSFTVDDALSDTSTNPVQNKTVTDALNSKLPKTGGTVTGALRTNDSFSAGGTISFGEAPIGLSQTTDGAAEIRYGSADVNDNPPPLSRLKVARPTADDDAATKKYVDDRNDSPQFKGYVTLTPANAPLGTGVGLSPTGSGNDFTLDISDVNEGNPTLLTGVKTPTDADTNAAATVEYVKAKVASGGSADAVLYTAQTLTDAQKKQARENIGAEIADFVVNGTATQEGAVTLDKTLDQMEEAFNSGKKLFVHLTTGELSAIMPLTQHSTNIMRFAIASTDNHLTMAIDMVVTQNNTALNITRSPWVDNNFDMHQITMASDPSYPMQIATKHYVDDHAGGAPIRIKLGTGNTATSTATFDEIKAALEAGKAPILDSAPGTSHWFALNWTLSGTDRLIIQYGTFNVEGGGLANFTFYDVAISSTGITYASRRYTTE